VSANFQPYIAKGRRVGDYVFDFHIEDLNAQEWYGVSADQSSSERAWCHEQIEPGMNILDCGAHHGMMTVLFSHWTGLRGQEISTQADRTPFRTPQ